MDKQERERLVEVMARAMADGKYDGGETLLEMYAHSALSAIEQSGLMMINAEALLIVVRKIDFGAQYPREQFASAFDELRCAFHVDELANGMPNRARETMEGK